MTTLDVPTAQTPLAPVTEVLAIAGRRMRRLRRNPGRLVGITLNPLITMIALGYLFSNAIQIPGSNNYIEFIFAGVVMQVGLASVGPTAIAVALDVQGGLVDRFRSLPITRSAVLIGHTLADLAISLIGLAIVVAFGVLFGWRSHTGILPTLAGFALVAVFIFTVLWVGVLLGMASKNLETIESVGGLVAVVFSFLSNGFLSVDKLPGWIQPIAQYNPVSSVISACRELWGNQAAGPANPVGGNNYLMIIVSLGVLFLVTSYLSVRRYRNA
ncbi:ABC transporter permease [Actinosynnema sp. NPDC047251]|uniref:Transport permease protein n=1 Tax=Saccharothrix espanaensis (strain ATCC 51144 / DSM 44229 / JCM 9112 / NBRC 15066 / NRRL 15764) TaxID=1179773 RepID=K0JZ68_SACES|nr:ABC transporter permease [Saccharothrix espanaensis]CCH30552.1 ABC-2 type transporter [Saccharothrix espanaensis DSM 44229]